MQSDPQKPSAWTLRPSDLPPEWILRREPRLRGLEENPYFRRLHQHQRRFLFRGSLRLRGPRGWIGPLLAEDVWLTGMTPEQLAQGLAGYTLAAKPLTQLMMLSGLAFGSLPAFMSGYEFFGVIAGSFGAYWLGGWALAPWSVFSNRGAFKRKLLARQFGFEMFEDPIEVLPPIFLLLSILVGPWVLLHLSSIASLFLSLYSGLPAAFAHWLASLALGSSLVLPFTILYGLWLWSRRNRLFDDLAEQFRHELDLNLIELDCAPANPKR